MIAAWPGRAPEKERRGHRVRGNGEIIAAPNAVMQDGREYVLNGDMADIPVAPECVVAIPAGGNPAEEPLPRSAGSSVVSVPPRPDVSAPIHTPESTPKLTRSAWCRRGRNETLNIFSFEIGTIVGAGWRVSQRRTSGVLWATSLSRIASTRLPAVMTDGKSGKLPGVGGSHTGDQAASISTD